MHRFRLLALILATTIASTSSWAFISRRKLVIKTIGSTAVAVGGTAAANALQMFSSKKDAAATVLYTPEPGSLEGQTIVLTGGTSGLGLESVKRLAVGGASVIFTARTDAKGQAALAKVQDYLAECCLPSDRVSFKVLDFDDLQTVKAVPTTWRDVEKVDVVLNNAGVMAIPNRQLTVDGYEKQIQTNHLGHFALTALLAPKLTPTARIINVSSAAYTIAAAGLPSPPDSLWRPEPSEYSPWKSYGQSKLANLLFTQELQRRGQAAGYGWTVTSLHPGTVTTDLGRHIMGEPAYSNLKEGKGGFLQETLAKAVALFLKTVPEGATTQIWLAAKADPAEDVRSKFYVDCQAKPLPAFATNPQAAARLWEESQERSGVEFKL